jgi:glycosyltransferase involved in cell wall biosynthesis
MAKAPISICIVARNEEEYIERCLKSVHGWADEILVVDGESADNTAKIARRYAKVFVRPNDPSHHVNKKWCFDQARNKWVFSLDADEALSDELKREIEQVIREDGRGCNGFYVRRIQLLHDTPLKFDWPGHMLRLYRKGKEKFKGERLHEYITIDGRIGYLKGLMLHFGWWRGIHHHLYKMNNYTTFDAQRMVELNERYTILDYIKRSLFQVGFMLRHRIAFNRFPYGFFFLIFELINESALYLKYHEFRRHRRKHTIDVNKYV